MSDSSRGGAPLSFLLSLLPHSLALPFYPGTLHHCTYGHYSLIYCTPATRIALGQQFSFHEDDDEETLFAKFALFHSYFLLKSTIFSLHSTITHGHVSALSQTAIRSSIKGPLTEIRAKNLPISCCDSRRSDDVYSAVSTEHGRTQTSLWNLVTLSHITSLSPGVFRRQKLLLCFCRAGVAKEFSHFAKKEVHHSARKYGKIVR